MVDLKESAAKKSIEAPPEIIGTYERLDSHNVSVNAEAVRAHCCGTMDLRTGRICLLGERHHGSCDFK